MTLSSDKKLWPLWAKEAYEERAAIMEYDGKVSREKAEREAEEEIRRIAEHTFLDI